MYFYIDESGFQGDYIFAAVRVKNPDIPAAIIKKWRSWMNHRVKNFCQNEYHDHQASVNERKKILSKISEYTQNEFKFWGVLKKDYNAKHKNLYVPTIVELLRHCQVNEKDHIVAVDRVAKKTAHMERYMRNVKKELGMPALNISYNDSEKEKGLQVADAVAGALSREYCPRPEAISDLDIIIHLFAKDLKVLTK